MFGTGMQEGPIVALTLTVALVVSTGCSRNEGASSDTAQAATEIRGSAGRLHVDDGGTGGIPVVFVHAYAGDAGQWAAQLEHLRPSRRAVAFDMRGHGRSEAPAQDDYSVASLSEDIAAVVDGLGTDRFVLVGHSMGGLAALTYAGRNPERVAGLVLVGTPGKVPAEQAQQVMAGLDSNYEMTMASYWSRLQTDAHPGVLEKLEAGRRVMPRERSMSLIRALFAHDPVAAISSYGGPKLAITTPTDTGPQALHTLVPDIGHKVVTGTSHWIQMDKPREFNQILDEFLIAIETRGPGGS